MNAPSATEILAKLHFYPDLPLNSTKKYVKMPPNTNICPENAFMQFPVDILKPGNYSKKGLISALFASQTPN
jgi:hypothetical protein